MYIKITRRFLFILLSLLFSLNSLADTRVSTSWLKQHLNDADLVLIDMADDLQYQRFHIPAARNLPYSALNRVTRQRVSFSAGRERLLQILGLLGAKTDSHIIIYDDLGGLNAARLYWELERLGHSRMAILDGGLVDWILAGYKVTNQPAKAVKSRYQPAKNKGIDNVATLDDVIHPSKGTVLLDVRSQQEYSGHPRQPRSGHIPGAKWWSWDNGVDFENRFKMKPLPELKTAFRKLGLENPDTPVILYCQSGHRASQVYYTLRQLGYRKVKVYDGSMAEYSLRKDLPLRKGMQP